MLWHFQRWARPDPALFFLGPCCAPRWALLALRPRWSQRKLELTRDIAPARSIGLVILKSAQPCLCPPDASVKSSCPIVHLPRNSRMVADGTRFLLAVLLILYPNHVSVLPRGPYCLRVA